MKSLTLVFFSFIFIGIAHAQQEYLLMPADSSGTIIINEGAMVKRITEQAIKVNRINRFEGYRIEIYQGNDRKEAKEILEKFVEEYPNTPAELVFENPYVKVKVGIFRSKLEAQQMFYTMKQEHDGAKIVIGKGLPFPPLKNKEVEDDKNIKVYKVEDF